MNGPSLPQPCLSLAAAWRPRAVAVAGTSVSENRDSSIASRSADRSACICRPVGLPVSAGQVVCLYLPASRSVGDGHLPTLHTVSRPRFVRGLPGYQAADTRGIGYDLPGLGQPILYSRRAGHDLPGLGQPIFEERRA